MIHTTLPEPLALPVETGWPDPLVTLDGMRVANTEAWREHRRPELRQLFAHYMYGYVPAAARSPVIRSRVAYENPRGLGGLATVREVVIEIVTPRADLPAPSLRLLVITPNKRCKPAPAFLGVNFCGNHAVTDDPGVALCDRWSPSGRPGVDGNRFVEAGRGGRVENWCARTLIERGYALATHYNGDLDKDAVDYADGVQPHYYTADEAKAVKPGPHGWGTIAVWAWGLSRAMDYLVTMPEIDGSRVATVGHSRNGKTALLAAAMDDRFAMAIPSQAGCGGTAPSRASIGELVLHINKGFPHWFNDTFKAFDGMPARLPFDQHCLAALVAPRPMLFSNAIDDQWANPWGQFDVLKQTDAVYRFLGVDGLAADRMPPLGKLVDSRLGYFIRAGGHSTIAEDWHAWLAFADLWL